MSQRFALVCIVGLMTVMSSGCARPTAPLIPVVESNAPIALAPPIQTAAKSIPCTELLLPARKLGPKLVVGNLGSTYQMLPIPSSVEEVAVLELSRTEPDNADSIHFEGHCVDSYEVARLVRTHTGWLVSAACGLANTAGEPRARIVSLLGENNRSPDSTLAKLLGTPLRGSFSLQSQLLGANSEVECTREFGDLGGEGLPLEGSQITLIAIDDCDSDGQGDFLLIVHFGETDERQPLGEFLSGKGLQTIAPVPGSEMLGTFACEVPDVDQDGHRDLLVTGESEKEYFLISPKTRRVIQKVTFSPGGPAYLREACNAGTTRGRASLAVAFNAVDAREIDRVAVVDVLTGTLLAQVTDLPGETFAPLVSGRIPGGSRRWLAYTTWNSSDSNSRVQLFIQEIGITDSTVQLLLPDDGRDYAFDCCAVAAPSSTHDYLAITVGIGEQTAALTSGIDPVMFLDVARCFDQH